MKIVDYYFDFMSPYAYLGCSQIPRLIEAHGAHARFVGHSFDMWAARLAAGNNGPSNREQPAKAKVLMADVGRWAKRYGIPLGAPKGQDTARLNRGFLVAKQSNAEVAYMIGVFARLWGAGGDPKDDRMLIDAASEAGLDGQDVLRRAESPEVLALYDRENREAQARGIFGAPMFVVDDQVYWGNDRIEWVEDYLREAANSMRQAAR